jgi:Ca2+-binding RTX toxin-like protein
MYTSVVGDPYTVTEDKSIVAVLGTKNDKYFHGRTDLPTATALLLGGDDIVNTGLGDDIVNDAGAGDDILEDHGGRDELHGKEGNDILISRSGGDKLFGGGSYAT